jgi:uncharacterized protein (DUF697 family)
MGGKMRAVYSIALLVGVLALLAWLVGHAAGASWDPEERLGLRGRRVVGGLTGFGLAGMSAEFAAKDLSPTIVLVAAVAGAAVAAWWAGYMTGEE